MLYIVTCSMESAVFGGGLGSQAFAPVNVRAGVGIVLRTARGRPFALCLTQPVRVCQRRLHVFRTIDVPCLCCTC